jgi:radical SAM superfamily enzyme YgiQ (UPF0313 family)
MKVVFLHRDSFIKIAIEQLSAVLKKNGHGSDVFIESGERNFLKSALESGADLFAFSCTTGGESWVLKTSAELKKKSSTPIIVGGPHATFFPDIIEYPDIDYICRGEGEDGLLELLEAMAKNPESIKDIRNIWSKDSSGKIYRTDIRPFIENLDTLPFPDFEIYAKYKYMFPYNIDMFPVLTGRGCPHNCSYCFNKSYKDLYRNKGKYLRRRSPDHVIRELLHAKETYGIRKINFVDDSFFLFPKWLEEFAVPYKEKVNLPFIVNIEATHVNEYLVRIIKEMGCICVRMGVETGNGHLRQDVLNKKVSNRQIMEAAGYIKSHGIKLATYNILGIPGETIANALETYNLNKVIGSDFVWCSLLQPYPGTAITEYASQKGFLEDENDETALNESYFVSSKIRMENKKEIVNLQKLMQVFIQMHIPLFMVRRIINLPKNPVFHLLFKLSFLYNKIVTQKLRLMPLIKLGLRSFTYMREQRSASL